MSKSKGNYIGITEPPKVMFRKVMQISDDLMWRYYELLTETSLEEIAAKRASDRPMEHKLALAARIVEDFHSPDAARQAHADFDREVRHHDVPQDIETIGVDPGSINLAKLLVNLGLADSRTDAERKIKVGAVEIGGEKYTSLNIELQPGQEYIFHVGKKWKKVNARTLG
jgi:tyrosyl-tRNA synthetase